MQNPYNPNFGIKPQEYITRTEQFNAITRQFDADLPASHIYTLIGLRGSGKTVMLSELSSCYHTKKEWIVINLSPDTDMIGDIRFMLNRAVHPLNGVHSSVSVTTPVGGISVSRDSSSEAGAGIYPLLEQVGKKHRKVLFLVDEVVSNPSVKAFASYFQIWLREEYPVYLVMAGLYENIQDLKNEKSLTFLYRAPKIMLTPLSLAPIVANYRKVFQISQEEALKMARLTKGYAFAFQSLGAVHWDHPDLSFEEQLSLYDAVLAENVYEKIWSELSRRDRQVVRVISGGKTSASEIRDALKMSSQLYNVYRKRLMDQGIVSGAVRGQVTLTLPRFDRFIALYCPEEAD